MKVKIEHSGWIEKGNLKLSNKKRFEQEIKSFPDSDVNIVIKRKGKRSSQSNRYYFGCVLVEIQAELLRRGEYFDIDDLHEGCKVKFNGKRITIEETGEVLDLGKRTSDLNQDEFGAYLERIIEWCSKSLEIVIPPPSSQADMKFD